MPRSSFVAVALGVLASACAVGSGSDIATNRLAGYPDAEDPAAALDAGADARASSSTPADVEAVTGESDAGGCAKLTPVDACGVATQCGCAATETCDLVAGVATCVASGGKPPATACGATSECQRGLTCSGGACRPFCESATSCSAPGLGACSATIAGSSLKTCSVSCDLHAPTAACGTGTCAWAAGATDCKPAGTKAARATCTTSDECGQGLACAPTIYGNMCLRWCRIGAGECPGFGLCTSVFGASAPKKGNVEYGVCP